MTSDRTLTGRTVRVIIPTTGVPAEVQSLVREDAEIPPIICIDGTSRQAGVQGGYRAWVRRPSGLIERLYGHGAFRVDVSSSIDVGDSWQLGLLLAHALEAEGRLSQSLLGEGMPPAALVWATGEVRPVDMAVCTVGHVEEKVRNSLELLTAAREAGLACLVLLPEGNAGDLPPDLVAALARLGIPVHPVGDALAALAALDLDMPQAAARERSAAATWQGNPYRGLESFERDHRAVFFGRGRAREESLELLRRAAARGRAFLLIHGRSGIGKSSLAMAGLAGDVLDKAQEGGDWRAALLRFGGGDPVERLATAICTALAAPDPAAATLAALFRAEPEGAAAAVLDLLPRERRTSLLVVADQLEQALVDLAPADAQALGRTLASLAESGRVWIVATMRSDRLDLVDLPGLTVLAADERLYRLSAPSLHELLEIVTQPAARAGLSFETGAAGDLPRELAAVALASPDSLPLLELVLTRLADAAGAGRVITRAIYERLGGFDGAIGRLADEAVATLTADGTPPAAIDRVLAALIRIEGESGEALSRALILSSLGDAERRVAHALVAARLAVIEGDDGQPPRLRLAHETLIRSWDRLDSLVKRLRGALLLRDRIELAAREWHAGGRDDSLLLRGAGRIAAATELKAQGLLPLSEFAADLVEASHLLAGREEQERTRALQQARNRTRGAIAMVLIMATLAVSLFFANLSADAARGEAERSASARFEAEEQRRHALIAAAETGRRTAALLAPTLVAKGEVPAALTTLLDAARPLDGVAEDLAPTFTGPLFEALAAARRLEIDALPAGAELVRSGRELFVHEPAAGRLSRFGADGQLRPIATDPLRPNRIMALRLLAGGDLVVVWDDALTQRFTPTGGSLVVTRSIAAPTTRTRFPLRAVIAADGTVLLSDVTQVHAVTSVDDQVFVVDTDAGRAWRVSPYSDFGDWIVDDGAGTFALVPEEEDRILAFDRNTAADSLQVHPESSTRTRQAVMAGACDADAPLPADMLEPVGRAVERYLSDPFTGWRDVRCLPLRSGVVLVASTLDQPLAYDVAFLRAVGNNVDLVAEAMSHLGLGNAAADSTTLLRAIDADPATGEVALVMGTQGIVLRPRQGNARSELVARFAVPYALPLVRLLDQGRVLLADSETGEYRRLAIDDSAEPGPALAAVPAPADPTPWRELREVLPQGGDPVPSARPERPIAFKGAVNADPRCTYSLSDDGTGYLTAGDDGVRHYALLPPEAGAGPVRAALREVIASEPARTALYDAAGNIVVTSQASAVRLFTPTGAPAGDPRGTWSARVLYRGTNVLAAEPDRSGRYLLITEQPDGSGVLLSLYDVASGTLVPAFSPRLGLSEAWFLADGTLAAASPYDSVTRYFRIRGLPDLLAEAYEWLARNTPDPAPPDPATPEAATLKEK